MVCAACFPALTCGILYTRFLITLFIELLFYISSSFIFFYFYKNKSINKSSISNDKFTDLFFFIYATCVRLYGANLACLIRLFF